MENVHRIIAELCGESRHIAFRRVLEEKARDHLVRLLVDEDYDQLREWYHPDVTMVIGLDTTLDGEILKGHDEIINYYLKIHGENEVLVVPVLTISDRGRVICYTETFYKWLGKEEKDGGDPAEPPFVGWPMVGTGDVLKMREVTVFDLDEEMKVKRVECRQLGMEHLGHVSLDASAKQSERLKGMIQGDI